MKLRELLVTLLIPSRVIDKVLE